MSAQPEFQRRSVRRSREEIRAWLVAELALALKVDRASIDSRAPLYTLGADSLTAITLTGAFAQWLQQDLPATLMWDYESLDAIAQALANPQTVAPPPGVVFLQAQGERPALFCFPGTRGHCVSFAPLATALGPGQPVYGLTIQGIDEERSASSSVEAVAAMMLQRVRLLQPKGPYQFAGYSFGGLLAFEAAQQLMRAGETVSLLVLCDTFTPQAYVGRPRWQKMAIHAYLLAFRKGRIRYLRRAIGRRKTLRAAEEARSRPGTTAAEVHQKAVLELEREHLQALERYRPQPYPGPVLLFRALEGSPDAPFFKIENRTNGWGSVATGPVRVIDVPGTHQSLLNPEHAPAIAQLLRPHLLGSR